MSWWIGDFAGACLAKLRAIADISAANIRLN
jgi:hypothetical protein